MYRIILLPLLTAVFLICHTSTQAQDWAQLNHYRKANEKIQSDSMETEFVFMGNSITAGWFSHYPEFFEGKPYANRGISGQTTPQMLVRFRQDVVELAPKAVIILAGTNDIAGNTGPSSLEMIMDNIKGMTEIALANDIEVILASVTPAYDYPWRPGLEPNLKIPRLNKMIKAYTEEKNIIFLDYFSSMKDDKNGMIESYAYDGVHPNRAGYEVMAQLTLEAMEKVLNK